MIHEKQGRSITSAQPSQKQELGAHSKKGTSSGTGSEDATAGKAIM